MFKTVEDRELPKYLLCGSGMQDISVMRVVVQMSIREVSLINLFYLIRPQLFFSLSNGLSKI